MRSYEELKNLLIRVKDDEYSVPVGADVDSVVADMLKFIGHTDAQLRDDLIYSTFNSWVENGTLTAAQMRHCLITCMGDTHLFYGIGEKDTDSVFTRSFSSLIIALALAMHNKNPFLTKKDIGDIKEAALRYIAQERDYRGYVDTKGWAHSVAHIADVLDYLAGCDETEGFLEILQAVKTLVCNKECAYSTEEDERLAEVILTVVRREALTNEEIVDWIDSFNMTDNEWWKGSVPADYYLHVNRKHFMRSFYFKLCSYVEYGDIYESLLDILV